MNTANLQNCKRLYELSGWGNEDEIDLGYYQGEDDPYIYSYEKLDHDKDHGDFFDGGYPKYLCPGYDSGYLLRKLPPFTRLIFNEYNWAATFVTVSEDPLDFDSQEVFERRADTPEDALCLLAIKLFEEGILTQ